MTMSIERLVALVVCGLAATSCGSSTVDLDAGTGSLDEPDAAAPVPAESASGDPASDGGDPDRFGDFPAESSNQWLIASEYVGTSFVDRSTGTELDGASISVQFGGRSQISVASSGCGIGGGRFDLIDGRVTNLEPNVEGDMCLPSDQVTYRSATALIEAEPEIRVHGKRLLLLSDQYRLELEATEPGVEPLVDDFERFVASESTVAGVDPSRIELTSPAFFVVWVALPTCDLHGSMTTEGEQRTLQMEPTVAHDPCEHSPPADKAAQAFFAGAPVASRTGEVLEVAGSQGTIRFRLATAEDGPLAREEVVPPPLVLPDPPDRSLPAEAGRPSAPWFAERAGSTAPGQADVPVPDEWEASDRSAPWAAVSGRGRLQVTSPAEPWDPDTHSDLLEVVEGPSPVTVKLYVDQGGEVVESGATATLNQYRYGSSDPNTWNRLVVWVLERGGVTTVAEVAYPEFPADSSFASTADTRNQSLTGLDPIDLLHDIRFFD